MKLKRKKLHHIQGTNEKDVNYSKETVGKSEVLENQASKAEQNLDLLPGIQLVVEKQYLCHKIWQYMVEVNNVSSR